jgi:hypothetical protein
MTEIRGDFSVLRSLDARRVDGAQQLITGTTILDRHSPGKILATLAAAADLVLPNSGLISGWGILVKNSALSTDPLTIKVGTAVVLVLLPGRAVIVSSSVEAPTTVADFLVVEFPGITTDGDIDASDKKIVNLAEPDADTDAATKGYVDGAIVNAASDKAGDGLVWDATNSEYDIDLASASGLELTGGQLRAARHFVKNFNATTDWGTAAGGYYTITVLASAHLQGVCCEAMFYRDNAGTFIHVMVDQHTVNASGDVAFRVPAIPDLRFAGKAIIKAVLL